MHLCENHSHFDLRGIPTNTFDAERAYGPGRLTAPRRAIARAASGMRSAFTVETLAERVRKLDPCYASTATVYRAVAAMESAGFLERVGTRRGAVLYACCAHSNRAHHHHIVCDACGRTTTTDCAVATELGESDTSGFVVTRHELTLYGLCPECAAKGGA